MRTPAASHRPLPYFGYVPWVKFKLFVHYSFIVRSLVFLVHALCKRSHPKDMLGYLGATFGSLGSIMGSLEAILGTLGSILGGLGSNLGCLGRVLGLSWLQVEVLSVPWRQLWGVLARSWLQDGGLGLHLGSQMEANILPKSIFEGSKRG